jgi:quercetin dioxygenase-like cupin family protein
MSSQPMVLRPDQQARPLNVVGMHITVLAANAATDSYGITIQEGVEGTGPPPHSHPWDEAFYVLGGEVKFECAGAASVCTAGTLVHVPRGTVHAFTFGQGGGRMLEIAGAGAQAAPFFTSIDQELPPGPPDVPKLLQLAQRHGVAFAI